MNADELIAQGRAENHYPVALEQDELVTVRRGLLAKREATVAVYQDGSARVAGENGGRYTALPIPLWEAGIREVERAGGRAKRPFSLDDGRKIVAEFDLPTTASGLSSTFTMLDSFDGTTNHLTGHGMMRNRCSNAIAALMRDGEMAKVRHTASVDDMARIMHSEIARAIEASTSLAALFAKACDTQLQRDAAQALFDALWPEAPEGAGKRATTIALNRRKDAQLAAAMPINREGSSAGTLWNAATYLVDRTADGKPRKNRGGSTRDGSMLLGTMGKRLESITQTVATLIDVIRPDGSIESLEVAEALDIGASPSQVGASIIDSMLGEE